MHKRCGGEVCRYVSVMSKLEVCYRPPPGVGTLILKEYRYSYNKYISIFLNEC